jgi:electron transfer flavoprotein beta subunit
MMARKKPLAVVEPTNSDNLTEVEVHTLPEPKGACKIIDADNAKELIRLLHEEAKAL